MLLNTELHHLQKVLHLKINQCQLNLLCPINGQKEKELSTLRWILLTTKPLSTVTNKAYIEHMHIIDPIFTVPGAKKIRMMIARSYGYNRDKLKLLLKTAQSISLTTDLWSSRSKHGYLGLTATWINKDFEIMDVLLEISYFPTPHTAQAITEVIKKAIQKWEIESQVISITADNGANIVAAIRDLEPIKRLSCAAHTLQLAINKAWDRLIFLQYAVLQLNINLSCSLKPEEKADGNRLKKLVLKDNEWELLDELCNILAPFEKATRDFSGSTYITLSQMFPIITNLTNSLKPVDNLHEEYEEPDDNTIISDTEENLTNQSTGIDYNNISEIQYDQLKREMQQQISTPPSPTITPISTISADTSRSSTPSTRSLHEYREMREKSIRKVFQTTEKSTASSTIADEITTYFLLPVARENKNPLNWWKTKKEIFPILSIIAQKYLGIPATSVASERLFSDAGNHITAKRSLLDPGLVGKMVFLKRNMQTMDHINVFPPDLEVENNDFVEDEDVLE
ncbi:zinc finger BED domain-containing protein 1-like [Rhizophagus irregularis DAOM 181602=DAOM 197198]|nr:zinc finger BED domain-containing protein 1-like [Rhizophagus irregularis DAOM 181602=DAOM 197198]